MQKYRIGVASLLCALALSGCQTSKDWWGWEEANGYYPADDGQHVWEKGVDPPCICTTPGFPRGWPGPPPKELLREENVGKQYRTWIYGGKCSGDDCPGKCDKWERFEVRLSATGELYFHNFNDFPAFRGCLHH